jgi:hypothetical protein
MITGLDLASGMSHYRPTLETLSKWGREYLDNTWRQAPLTFLLFFMRQTNTACLSGISDQHMVKASLTQACCSACVSENAVFVMSINRHAEARHNKRAMGQALRQINVQPDRLFHAVESGRII